MEKIELGKRAKNNKKRPRPFNDAEPLLKRPKSRGDLVSNTPSPMMVYSRPGSVLSTASTAEPPVNGSLDRQGSTDGSEGNPPEGSAPSTTPIRKLGTSRLGGGVVNAGGSRKQTAAPLGGRGKMQKSSKKAGSRNAASAGAIAGAKAANNAALAAYGLPTHHISVSPSGSPAVSGSSHSSPRVSPVPMAFVATSLITTPPTNKLSSKTTSLGSTPPTNKNSKAPSSLTYAKSNL